MGNNDFILMLATLVFAIVSYSFWRVNRARERAYNDYTKRRNERIQQVQQDNPAFKPGGYHSGSTTGGNEFIISKEQSDRLLKGRWRGFSYSNPSHEIKTEFTEKEVIESQPEIKSEVTKNDLWEIEQAIKKGNANLLEKYGSQEKVDEYLKEFKDKLRKKFENSGHLPKNKS